MLRLLIADESDAVRLVGMCILKELNFVVFEASSALDALAKCEQLLPDIIIIDSAMAGALDLIANIRIMPGGAQARILYSLVQADLKSLMAARRAGANDVLLKPFDRKVLSAIFANLAIAAA
jgi:two-component system chemotaxis response regulator CheY